MTRIHLSTGADQRPPATRMLSCVCAMLGNVHVLNHNVHDACDVCESASCRQCPCVFEHAPQQHACPVLRLWCSHPRAIVKTVAALTIQRAGAIGYWQHQSQGPRLRGIFVMEGAGGVSGLDDGLVDCPRPEWPGGALN